MSATNAPFGFLPSYHPTGLDRAKKYTIASGYATQILKNTPVILNTNGTIVAGAPASDLIGTLIGVQYTDANGKPTYSNFWPAGATGTNIVAWVLDEPEEVYEVQADGSVPQTAIGDHTDVTNIAAGAAQQGLSASTVSATLAGAGVQGQFRIVGFNQNIDNAAGDAFTILQVKIARHQYYSNKVAV